MQSVHLISRPMAAAGIMLALLLTMPSALHGQYNLPPGTTDTNAPTPQQDPLLTQAQNALSKGDFPTAYGLLNQLVAKYPNDATILYNLGFVEDARNNNEGAANDYRKAIAARADYFEPHLALGLLLARTGKLTEAHAELARAITLDTPDKTLKARAYRALARLDQSLDPASASNDLLEALKLSPETADDAQLAGELAEASHDLPAAEAAYRRSLAERPGDPGLTAALAHVLLATHRAAEAENLLTAANTAHPDDPTITSQLAAAYAAQGKAAEAIPLIEKLREANPSDTNLELMLAHLYTQTRQFQQAEPLYAALSAASPHDVLLLADHGENQLALGDNAGAQATLTQAIADPKAFTDPADLGEAAGSLALAASRNDSPAAVLHALQIRAKVLPQSPASLFLAATAQDALHHSQQASELYKQFLSAAAGKFPEEEAAARSRVTDLAHHR